ncbi:MAG: DUF1467 family protein [Rhodobacter sp.]|nr:DUF1467 family protein [Paracoccaceae bacterium]MCC0073639.1 DUF1467 family protein [Rhodobacter sp.]HPD93118.1 DUF1467 family protein [Pararhodobacter sp.]
MSPVSGFVLYAFLWFLTLLVVLPIRLKTQEDVGEVVPGTPRSAPADPQIGKRVIITTIAATVIYAIIVGIILSGVITVNEMDFMNHWMNGR